MLTSGETIKGFAIDEVLHRIASKPSGPAKSASLM
jgi:hypothetical protein